MHIYAALVTERSKSITLPPGGASAADVEIVPCWPEVGHTHCGHSDSAYSWKSRQIYARPWGILCGPNSGMMGGQRSISMFGRQKRCLQIGKERRCVVSHSRGVLLTGLHFCDAGEDETAGRKPPSRVVEWGGRSQRPSEIELLRRAVEPYGGDLATIMPLSPVIQRRRGPMGQIVSHRVHGVTLRMPEAAGPECDVTQCSRRTSPQHST